MVQALAAIAAKQQQDSSADGVVGVMITIGVTMLVTGIFGPFKRRATLVIFGIILTIGGALMYTFRK